jgi:hypothetical protein
MFYSYNFDSFSFLFIIYLSSLQLIFFNLQFIIFFYLDILFTNLVRFILNQIIIKINKDTIK